MATIDEDRPMDEAAPTKDVVAPSHDVVELESLKRKASRDDEDEESQKRLKHEDDDRIHADRRRSRQDSPPSRRSSHGNAQNFEHDRRKSATQEEKKRGKRLFGGLLNTLSQTTGSSQHKRRMEIERRQQDRMQKQKAEDESKRIEKRARLTEIRMSEQIGFEEEVMRHKHSKMLAVARFLRTKSHPQIHYLPWRLTPDQEDEIDDQVKDAKAAIEKELEAFKERKQWHERDHGRSTRRGRSVTPEKPPGPVANDTPVEKAKGANGTDTISKGSDKEHHSQHHHDESADVLEEEDEDMVIY